MSKGITQISESIAAGQITPIIYKDWLFQECSVFLFEKRCAEKLHKPKRKETVTEILRSSVRQLERFRHPKILHVLHPIEECADTLAFASEPVFASLANILAHQEATGHHGAITTTGSSQQPNVRPTHSREYSFLDIEYKYGILQVGTFTVYTPRNVTAICLSLPYAY